MFEFCYTDGDNVKQDVLEAMYAYICRKHRETSRPPTLRELANAFYMSTGVVTRHLAHMEGQGWILRETGKARGIMLLRPCGTAHSDALKPD